MFKPGDRVMTPDGKATVLTPSSRLAGSDVLLDQPAGLVQISFLPVEKLSRIDEPPCTQLLLRASGPVAGRKKAVKL